MTRHGIVDDHVTARATTKILLKNLLDARFSFL